MRLMYAAMLSLLAVGCGGSQSNMMMASPPIPDAANALPASDPRAAGQALFYADTFGTEALDTWPPPEFLVALQTSEPEVFGNQFASFGFISDPTDDLPIGLKRGSTDRTKVHQTCNMCHVGRLPDGRVWIGAPNIDLDVGRFRAEVNARWVSAGHTPLIGALEEAKVRQLGPGRTNAGSSDYPTAVPADFPNYFTLGRRTHLNYIGTGGNVRTEVSFSIYSAGAGSPNPETAKVQFPPDSELQTFLDFFATIEPPTAPAGDVTLIARGQTVFQNARCGSCHHVGDLASDGVTPVNKALEEKIPGDDPMWPKGAIATDLAHRALIDSMGPPADAPSGADAGTDSGYLDLLRFAADHNLSIYFTDGYRVNDLRALWATPPYLHNGSVPTLEDLLRPPADRPKQWMRGSFLVDTTVPGNTNQGHTFGTDLSDDDKTALVAYLKSL